MGMYATICDKRVKFSGTLAQVASQNGIVAEDGMATITRDQAPVVLTCFVFAMEQGRQLIEGHNIQGQAVYSLAKDAAVLAALFDWVVFGKENAIHFA